MHSTLGTLAFNVNYNLDLSGSLNPLDKFSVQAKFDLGDSAGVRRGSQQAETLYLQGVEEFANGNYAKAIDAVEAGAEARPEVPARGGQYPHGAADDSPCRNRSRTATPK